MNRFYVCLFFFLTSFAVGFAQQKDSLKHSPVPSMQDSEELKLNKETLDAIRNGTLIGPLPERRPKNRDLENRYYKDISAAKRNQELLDTDSIMALRISDDQKEEWKAWGLVHHKRTTVDDPQLLANPHISLSFNDLLCFLFKPDMRAKMRNKKHAKAYKTYNE